MKNWNNYSRSKFSNWAVITDERPRPQGVSVWSERACPCGSFEPNTSEIDWEMTSKNAFCRQEFDFSLQSKIKNFVFGKKPKGRPWKISTIMADQNSFKLNRQRRGEAEAWPHSLKKNNWPVIILCLFTGNFLFCFKYILLLTNKKNEHKTNLC